MITQHSVKEEKQKLCNENAKSIFSKVLFIGIDYHHPRGGVAAVEYVYSQWIHPFKFVATTVAGNKMVKLLVFFRAVFLFVWKLLWDRQIRIIHVHGASDASFWRKRIFILIAKAFKKRIIYHCHGAEFKRFASQHHHAVQSLLKKCNSIIALSDSWKEWFQNTFDCKNVIVIKNIIPEPKMEKGSKYQDKPDLCTLLFLGRLGKRKGIYDLIDVIADNRSCYEGRIKLWIGGDGESENVCAIIKERGLEDMISYEGWISGEHKIRLLNQANAYILPSYNEGLPISILEAMSYQLPIISTKVGGIPEIVKDGVNGYLIEPGNKQQLKSAIDKLIFDKSIRVSMGLTSAQMVSGYLPEYVMNQLSEMYHYILANEKVY